MRALAVLPLLGCLATGCILVYGEAENTGSGGAAAGGSASVGATGGGGGASATFRTVDSCGTPPVLKDYAALGEVLDVFPTETAVAVLRLQEVGNLQDVVWWSSDEVAGFPTSSVATAADVLPRGSFVLAKDSEAFVTFGEKIRHVDAGSSIPSTVSLQPPSQRVLWVEKERSLFVLDQNDKLFVGSTSPALNSAVSLTGEQNSGLSGRKLEPAGVGGALLIGLKEVTYVPIVLSDAVSFSFSATVVAAADVNHDDNVIVATTSGEVFRFSYSPAQPVAPTPFFKDDEVLALTSTTSEALIVSKHADEYRLVRCPYASDTCSCGAISEVIKWDNLIRAVRGPHASIALAFPGRVVELIP